MKKGSTQQRTLEKFQALNQVGNTRFQNHNPKKFADFQTTRTRRLLEDLEWAEKHLLALNPVLNRFYSKLQSAENNPSKYVKNIQKMIQFCTTSKKT